MQNKLVTGSVQMGIFARHHSSSARKSVNFKYKTISEKSPVKGINNSYKKIPKNNQESQTENFVQVSSDLLGTQMKQRSQSFHEESLVYGIFPVLHALRAQRRTFSVLYYKDYFSNKNENIKEIYELCQKYNIPSQCVPKSKLNKLIGEDFVHQGVCLKASPLPVVNLDKLCDQDISTNDSKKLKLWLYLDQINDPMNMGAILRTAHYFGIDRVITSGIKSCPITSVVSKASSGAAEIVPLYKVSDVAGLFKFLQNNSWQIIISSTSHTESISLDRFQPTKNMVLIVGNEGRGVSRALDAVADHFVTIPSSSDDISSLNVSVATSIFLYSLTSKLYKTEPTLVVR